MPDHDRLAMPPQQEFIALLLPAIQAAHEGTIDTFDFTVEGSPPGTGETPYTLTITGTLLEGDGSFNGVRSEVSVEHDGEPGTFTHTFTFGFDVDSVLTVSAEYDFF